MSRSTAEQDQRYREAAATYGAALGRLAGAYERDPDRRRDLLQDIHVALWTSFASFEGRCSVRTWVYRVAHNTATAYVVRQRRSHSSLVELDQIEDMPGPDGRETVSDHIDSERLIGLIEKLKPDERQIMVLYLEGLDSPEIGEITGISAGHVRTRVHRIKKILAGRFHEGRAS